MTSWLKLARKITHQSKHKQFHHAAIVLKGGAIMAFATNVGWNHAEASALNKIWKSERKGCVLISVRFTGSGLLANAKPCLKCQAVINESKLAAVWYSTANREFIKAQNT